MDLHLIALHLAKLSQCDSAFLADDLFYCSTLSTVELCRAVICRGLAGWSAYQSWSQFVTPLTDTCGNITSHQSVLLSPLFSSLKISSPGQAWPAAPHQLSTLSFLSFSWGDPACTRELGRPASHLHLHLHHRLQHLLPPPQWCNHSAHDLLVRPRQHSFLLESMAGAVTGRLSHTGDCLSISPCVVTILESRDDRDGWMVTTTKYV